MGKKEIITTALVTALLVTTQVVPVSAAECAVPNTMSAIIPAQLVASYFLAD